MRKESRRAVYVTPHFVYGYIAILGLSLVLVLLGQFVLNDELQLSADDTHIVYVESQQRMLSQRVSMLAQNIEVSLLHSGFQARQHYKQTLSVTLTQWQQVHDTNTIRKNDEETSYLLSSLEPYYHSLLNASYTLLATINTPSSTSHAMIVAPVRSILNTEPTYLHLVNTLITRYQQAAGSHVVYLLYIDFIAFGGTVMVVGECVFLLFIRHPIKIFSIF